MTAPRAPHEASPPAEVRGETQTPQPASFAFAAFLYARLLAWVMLCAFVSLALQIDGLYGDQGLTPVSGLFAMLEARPDVGFAELPTLVWLWPTARALELLCASGVLASVLLFVGVAPRSMLLVAWAAHVSLLNAGMPWTSFQWDLLLTEVLLGSVFYVPPTRIDRFDPEREPSLTGRWLLWLLLLRLMFRSGLVKLASGDATWADLSALDHHYSTQPLPTLLGWYASHLPPSLNRLACAAMFGIELALPFLILIPRPIARRAAAAGFVALMTLIGLTGNYGFFNLLTAVLALTLVDDAVWRRWLPRIAAAPSTPNAATRPTRSPLAEAMSALLIVLGLVGFGAGLGARETDPLAWIRPLRSLNDYGLFAIMTTTRPELELEGSLDAQTWRAYRFVYKVGPLDRAPVQAAPHQPRLDWQMWFAALAAERDPERMEPWLLRLMEQLVANEPAVLALLDRNPFMHEAPRFVRAVLYLYRPTRIDERARSGLWWSRERLGEVGPMVMRGGE